MCFERKKALSAIIKSRRREDINNPDTTSAANKRFYATPVNIIGTADSLSVRAVN
jgi:hypothetical protein